MSVDDDPFAGISYEDALRKCARLLKLAERAGTVEESAAAMAKASVLMERFSLTRDAVVDSQEKQEPEDTVTDFNEDPLDVVGEQLARWRINLSSCIANAHGCAMYMSHRVAHDDEGNAIRGRFDQAGRYHSGSNQVICLVGRKSDVDTARYIYRFALSEMDRLVALHGKGMGKTWRNNFRLGVVEAIDNNLYRAKKDLHRSILQEAADDPVDADRTLVAINSAINKRESAQKEAEEKLIHLRQRRGGDGGAHDYSARLAGRQAGSAINMNSAKTRRIEKRK